MRLPRTKSRFLLPMIALALGTVGCGGPKPFPNSVHVSGTVTLDGAPLERGQVRFAPDGPGQSAVGMVKNGRFAMQTTASSPGVVKGRYKVSLISREPESEEYAMHPDLAPPPKSLIPLRYGDIGTSGFEVDVAGPIRDLTLELKSE